MFNKIKAAALINAIRKVKVASMAGGKGKFAIKGIKSVSVDHEIFKSAEKSIIANGSKMSLGSIEIVWDFPMSRREFGDGKIIRMDDEEAHFSLKIEGFKVENDHSDFEIEEIEIEGFSQIKDFMLELPLDDLKNLLS